jgi:Aromatic-ring-opening dioxygenase LigAB, LigA subunit
MKGYRLSKALQDHNSPPKMQEFLSNVDEMAVRYELTVEEVDAIKRADIARLNELGGNPYLIRFAFRDKFAN